jgi:hypothetical protein
MEQVYRSFEGRGLDGDSSRFEASVLARGQLPRLKSRAAILLDRDLLNGGELALQACEFRCLRIVATYQESGRPKHDDCRDRRDFVFGSFAVLHTRKFGSSLRASRRLGSQLRARVLLILKRRDICRRNILGPLGT